MISNYSVAAVACLAMASMCFDLGQSLVIGNSRPFIPGRSLSMGKRNRNRSSPMKMYIDDTMMPFDIASLSPSFPPTTASVTSTPSNIFCATSKLITSDPQLEAELLTDFSHVALDVSTFLSPNTLWLRFLNVLGRVLVLSSDYIQDNSVAPDEFFFQVSMLAFSTHMLVRSAWPLMLAAFSVSALTVRDRRAYALLFDAVGLSVLQFKTLLVSRTIDWLQYFPDESEELNGEYMYFLYSGEAAIAPASTKTGNRDIFTTDNPIPREGGLQICNRIFGDVEFAKQLEASVSKKVKKNAKSDKKKLKSLAQETTNSTISPRSFTVGSNGACMLRISTSKLLKLMENDDELSGSIQRLILLCMQEKLSRTLQDGGLKSSSKKNAGALQPSDSFSSTPNATYTIPATI